MGEDKNFEPTLKLYRYSAPGDFGRMSEVHPHAACPNQLPAKQLLGAFSLRLQRSQGSACIKLLEKGEAQKSFSEQAQMLSVIMRDTGRSAPIKHVSRQRRRGRATMTAQGRLKSFHPARVGLWEKASLDRAPGNFTTKFRGKDFVEMQEVKLYTYLQYSCFHGVMRNWSTGVRANPFSRLQLVPRDRISGAAMTSC